jgi:hypothetical protein
MIRNNKFLIPSKIFLIRKSKNTFHMILLFKISAILWFFEVLVYDVVLIFGFNAHTFYFGSDRIPYIAVGTALFLFALYFIKKVFSLGKQQISSMDLKIFRVFFLFYTPISLWFHWKNLYARFRDYNSYRNVPDMDMSWEVQMIVLSVTFSFALCYILVFLFKKFKIEV